MKELISLALSSKTFNTNNGWGFGGGYGTEYTLKNNVVIRTGKACYRHAPPSAFIAIYFEGKRIIDTSKLSTEQIEKVKELIK
jgi:hypothetical protein